MPFDLAIVLGLEDSSFAGFTLSTPVLLLWQHRVVTGFFFVLGFLFILLEDFALNFSEISYA